MKLKKKRSSTYIKKPVPIEKKHVYSIEGFTITIAYRKLSDTYAFYVHAEHNPTGECSYITNVNSILDVLGFTPMRIYHDFPMECKETIWHGGIKKVTSYFKAITGCPYSFWKNCVIPELCEDMLGGWEAPKPN